MEDRPIHLKTNQNCHLKDGDTEMPWMSAYRHYWTQEESVEGINLKQLSSIEDTLNTLKGLVKDRPKLIEREFMDVDTAEADDCVVRVMTWNILAQGLSTGKDNFRMCSSEALEWEYRRLKIIEEILRVAPDVACFQEVDHFGFLNQVMKSVGYTGCFFPKPDSPALYVEDTNGPDGCALFYKTAKFTEVKCDTIILRNIVTGQHTNQVCIGYHLKLNPDIYKDKELYVATTHLKAKYGWEKLRESQGAWLLQYLKDNIGSVPLVVCGDFNADPEEAVYQLFQESDLNLFSVYRMINMDGNEPPYTTWKIRDKEIRRTIDYIWSSKKSLRPKALLKIPSPEQIGENRLPSMSYPSDHVSLAVDLIL